MKGWKFFFALAVLLAASVAPVVACTTLIVTKGASADGSWRHPTPVRPGCDGQAPLPDAVCHSAWVAWPMKEGEVSTPDVDKTVAIGYPSDWLDATNYKDGPTTYEMK